MYRHLKYYVYSCWHAMFTFATYLELWLVLEICHAARIKLQLLCSKAVLSLAYMPFDDGRS